MLLEKETAEQSRLSGAKKALLQKRLRAAMEHPREAPKILRRGRRDQTPLSYEQERLWFLDQLEPNSPLYSLPLALRFRGRLEREALQKSLTAIVRTHEVLRTRVVAENGEPVQVTDEPTNFELPLADLSRRPTAEREIELRIRLFSEARRPFDLSRELMLRAVLYRLADDEHVLLLNMHHIASDSWSWAVFFRELTRQYAAFSANAMAQPPELPIQYADFAAWQRERLKGSALVSQLAYWRKQLAGAPALLELPTDKPRPQVQSFRGATQNRSLPRELTARVQELSRREGATPFMVLLAAFKALLVRYTQQEDLIVGSPIAGRNHAETQSLIGFFVNTLAIRTDASGDPSFRELMQRVRKVLLDACAFQELPFDKLVEELRPTRSSSFAPLVQVMFVYQNPLATELQLPGLAASLIELENGTAKFDLTLFLEAGEHGLRATAEYNTDLFEPATIARMLQHFEVLLTGATDNPGARISELPLLVANERDQLMNEWTGTATEYPSEKTIAQLFEDQVDLHPDSIAVEFGNKQFSYRELEERANQLAHRLQRLGVGPDVLVALSVERSFEMVAALLGILKAGGAYVSLDASWPQERLQLILQETSSPVLITSSELRPKFEFASSQTAIISLDEGSAVLANESPAPVERHASAENLAYVSFTSGSTGKPKGVCVPHRGVVRLVKGTNYASLGSNEIFLLFSPLAFDASTFEIWGALANGAKLVIFPPRAPSLKELGEFIRQHRISTLWLTAGLFHQMVEEQIESLRGVRQLLAGGDVLSVSHVATVLEKLPNCRLINGYGPTENTTFTCCHTIKAPLPNHRSISIGRPIANTEVFVLDQHLLPAPIGVPGQLYAGGDGLARGYLNQPELTAAKFVAHPTKPGARLYRTGDLVRWLPDGSLEFIGRNDGQVKIRGFRVETEEIEAALERHPEVKQSAAVARQESGEKRLIAYVVTRREVPPSASVLRGFLQRLLPDYMVPSAFVFLDSLPLSATGKVDRRALPAPDRSRLETDRKFVAPRDDTERQMAQIWEELLGTRPIGALDNFFELGGHSLLAIRLLSRIEKTFSKALPVAIVFQAPTLEEVARMVRAEKPSLITAVSSIVEIQARGSKPPLFLVHGAGGGMFWGYTNLAKCLGSDQPVFAFKSRGLDGLDEFATVEEMASYYIADMQARQPHGPYYVGGYCFGGNVAYEMARQLEAQGERIALLALMNSAPPNSKYVRVTPTPLWLARFIANICYFLACYFHRMPKQRRDFITWQLRGLGKRLARRLALLRDASRVHPDEVVDLSSYPPDQRRIWEAHIHSLFSHHTQPYAGQVTLLRSQGHQFWCSFDEAYGWREFVRNGVTVHIVPGAHEQILEEPHVELLAKALVEDLHRAQTENSPGVHSSSGASINELMPDKETSCPGADKSLAAPEDGPTSIEPRAIAHSQQSTLSLAQERMWFIEQLEPGSAVHNLAVALPFRGGLDANALQLAFDYVVRHHTILRTTFPAAEGKPVCVVNSSASVPLEKISLPGSRWDPVGMRLAVRIGQRPFDPSSDSLFRGILLSFSDVEATLVLSAHQMTLDRSSMDILTTDLLALYRDFVSGKPVALPELHAEYSDFAESQRERLRSAAAAVDLGYWKKQLAGTASLLAWPTDRPRPAVESHRGARHPITLSAPLTDSLRRLGDREKSGLFEVLLASFQALAHRYTGRDDIIFGLPTSHPKGSELKGLIGNFANTLPLRTSLSGDPTFSALLARLRSTLEGAFAHQELPFEKVLDEIHPTRDRSYHPLFQTMFHFQSAETSDQQRLGGAPGSSAAAISPVELDLKIARCDLALELRETASGIEGWIEYATDLFDSGTIQRLAENWRTLLKGVAADPDRSLSALPVLSPAEDRRLRIEWNATASAYEHQKSISALFEAQVERTPDAAALAAGETTLTYRELNDRANQLARRLQTIGIHSESLVGICLERSWRLVVAILGVLKSGGAYVPLDPAYPKDRLSFILEDARAEVLLTQSDFLSLFPTLDAPVRADASRINPAVLCLDLDESCFASESRDNLLPGPRADNLAYAIYTSGSTGKPKGVGIEHRSVVALVHWAKAVFTPDELSGALASTSICFDLSVFELFVPLSLGGKVILTKNALELPALAPAGVTLVNTVPSALTELLRLNGVPPSVKVINLAGEPLSCSLVDRIYQDTAVKKVYDLYGPSETTVYSTFALRKAGEAATIGRPLTNERIYLLDQNRQLVPIGVPGELYIGGDGLGREYLHRPELTAEKFVPDPFAAPGSGQRLYRTGDLARYRADGNIEFLGRIDFQVKIRGFRIELGEVEAALRQSPSVQECIVLAREDQPGDKRLVAYLVLRPDQNASADDLRVFLREKLPDYMVPSVFVILPALPLTPNGKVDRKQLPAPEQTRSGSAETFVAPSSPTEQKLAGIWREVLGVKAVGVRDNFFDLGGHSLLAIQVLSRIRQEFKLEVPLAAIFDAPTIAALAEGLSDKRWFRNESAAPQLRRTGRPANIPLSFSQERLWFIDQLEPGKSAYNVPCAVALNGPLDVVKLRSCLTEVVRRHEVLRTTFSVEEGEPVQVIAPEQSVELLASEVASDAEADNEVKRLIHEEAQRPFNLAVGPLIRCRLLRLHETSHIFILTMHHTVSDGWSLGVFFRELAAFYSATAGTSSDVEALPVQYADYAIWQRRWLRGDVLEKQLAYWKESLAGAPGSIDLPLDHPREENSNRPGGNHSITFSRSLVESLSELNSRAGVTLYMSLLASLAAVLNKWTGQADLVIGTVVAGRTRAEVENLIGCFMNFLPLRMKIAESETLREVVARSKATVLQSQPWQDCPFEKMVEAINPERRLDRNPIYNVGFLLQNFPRTVFQTSQVTGTVMPIESDAPLLDLMFQAEEDERGLTVACQYRSDLFDSSTIENLLESFQRTVETLVAKPETPMADLALSGELEQAETARLRRDKDSIVIAATFTAEPIEEPLRFWLNELEFPGEIAFAPYNQVFQQLLDPGSLLTRNSRGINVVLVRMEDWDPASHGPRDAITLYLEKIEQHTREFMTSLKQAAAHSAAPYLVCVCPSVRASTSSSKNAAFFHEMETRLATELTGISGVHLVTTQELQDLYPVADPYDPHGDELGHVPYTPAFFTALATMVARKFHLLKRAPSKVVVLDCDNTLWAGVCGEDGPTGIRLDSPWRELQQFMREQAQSGRVLCLCSKNNEEDVSAVFAQRSEMPLRRDDFVATRINWRPKSENLKTLAKELNLGLDSFVFVDDNPVECAEVEANCPEVTVLQLPEPPDLIPQFLKHCWVFDRSQATAEDRQRTAQYQQNRLRDELHGESLSLADFLTRLDLKVRINELSEDELPRVSQLTHRTNQFNFTTRRRSEADIKGLEREGFKILTTSVTDRFGDYGLVGVAIYHVQGERLDVDTLLLSCRVLGRGVEHQLFAHLGQLAREQGASYVDVHFSPTKKNQPALDFVNGIGASFRQASNGGYLYRFPAEVAVAVKPGSDSPAASPQPVNSDAAGSLHPSPLTARPFSRWRWLALEASEANKIVQLIEAKTATRSRGQLAYAEPRNEVERQLCETWGKLLRIDRIGVHDNFFQLGGHSLLAVRLFAELEKVTHKKLPIVTIFQAPTVAQLAGVIRAKESISDHPGLVPIQPAGSNPPLFLVHGAGGDVLWGYANLAQHLSVNQPVYGIRARHSNELGSPEGTSSSINPEFESVEAMAAHYVSELRAFQPRGPYYLGGYCFGGNVAYEMARQLRAAGEEMALVALLECAPSNGSYERPDWRRLGFIFPFARNLRHWMVDFLDFSPAERRSLVARKLKALGRKIWRRIRRPAGNVSVDLEDVIDPTQFPDKELKLWQAHLDLMVRHTSKPYPGNVTVFRTRAHPLVCTYAPDLGWSELAQEGVDVRVVPGSHARIFVEPNIRELAKELQSALAAGKPETKDKTESYARSYDERLAA
jgi:amino acid adenylation domain-containing protein/FkbH-like protein